MMATFKTTRLDITHSIHEMLCDDHKRKFSLTTEKKIREATLSQVMSMLYKHMITKDIENYKGIFAPKYRTFHLLR